MISGIKRILRIRFTRRHIEREVDEELAFHIARRAEALRAGGLSAEAADVEARRRFGDVDAARDSCIDEDVSDLRRERMTTLIESLRSDLALAWRSLKRTPMFTAVALTTLSIGIASVTTIVCFVYAWAFRPLPYTDADRIVSVEEVAPGGWAGSISTGAVRAILQGGKSFDRIGVYSQTLITAAIRGDRAEQLRVMRVDSSFAPMFSLRPQYGRGMSAEEIDANAPVASISDALWRRAFGSDTTIFGKPVMFGDERLIVVGVMPPGFNFPSRTDIWRPFRLSDSATVNVALLGRLAHGVSRERATLELKVIQARLARMDSAQFFRSRLRVQDMVDRNVGAALPLTSLFIGAAIFVLIIACSNVANLLLVRAAERRAQMAVRSALGASRRRLFTQALSEPLLLSIVAGIIGTGLAALFIKLAFVVLPMQNLPSWLHVGMDSRILLFIIASIGLVTIAVGVSPAREGIRFDLVRALKASGDGGAANSVVTRRGRRGLVVQLALSLTLSIAAGLLVKTYTRLTRVDVGYPANQIAELNFFFGTGPAATDSARFRAVMGFADELSHFAGARRIATRGYVWPAVFTADTKADRTLRGASARDARLFIDGDTTRALGTGRSIYPYPRYMAVSDDYFATLDLRVVRGRGLMKDDVKGSQFVIVISRRFAEILWPHDNPIGRSIQFGAQSQRITVVGVVEDVRDVQGDRSGMQSVPRADAYVSIRQFEATPAILLRTDGDAKLLASAAEAAVHRANPSVVTHASTMAAGVESGLLATKILGSLLAAFALSGLILSIIGTYGIVAYGIAQRTREIGIRIALGGTSADVLNLILQQSARFVAIGLVIGLGLALAAGRGLRVLLFGVSPADPMTYVVVSLLFAAVALLACYFPARRVTRVDPLVALRAD